MKLSQRISTFVELGGFLKEFLKGEGHSDWSEKLKNIVYSEHIYNPWFTENNIRKSLKAISKSLEFDKINLWLEQYTLLDDKKSKKKIGVIMAGNLPLVGFLDFISVLISGNIFIGKLSSKDNNLLKFFASYLISIEEEFEELIYFTESKLGSFDAIIATGSNNTSRYFEYYFQKYPHIIRKNRNSIGVLTGNESEEDMKLLGDDIFSYFGLGCRNVSKIFIPKDFLFEKLFDNIVQYEDVIKHNKYANNYDYNKSIYLMNQTQIHDNGFVILKEDFNISSPIGVLFYEYYNNIHELKSFFYQNREQIQCFVSAPGIINEYIPFGKAQKPELWDYADNIDTMEFLLGL